MSTQEPTTDASAAAGAQPESPGYEPREDEDEGVWADEGLQLPRRPRRRLLTPVSSALLAVILTAAGFLAGVLVEKGQGSSASSAGGAGLGASRFARAGAAGAASSGAGGLLSRGGGGATIGQVAFIQGSTLYVTDTQGNTVKVTTSAGSAVTKSVKASVKGIRPGETVVVTGTTGADGAVTAESIRVGGAGEGGLGAAFGRSGAKSGGGEPSLFGNGG